MLTPSAKPLQKDFPLSSVFKPTRVSIGDIPDFSRLIYVFLTRDFDLPILDRERVPVFDLIFPHYDHLEERKPPGVIFV